jgi:hypothetical protein
MVRENCTFCFAGKVNCPHCQGRGKNVCGGCQSSGRVKIHEVLTVKFHPKTETAVLDATGVPDYLIHKADGEVIVQERGVIIEQCPAAPPDVMQRAQELLGKAKAVNQTDTIILQQELQVRQVAIQEVIYRYPTERSPERKLWIYGSERHVHAPGAPTNWGRIILIAGCALVVIGGVLAALLMVMK